MDQKTQKIFFQSSVDMDLIGKFANEMIAKTKEAGNPKRLIIEIRKADSFDENLSMEEIFERIDKEYSQESIRIDLLRAYKTDDYYVITGVKL